jgi:hypothetical protein
MMTIRSVASKLATLLRRQRWSFRPPRPTDRPEVRVEGPNWFVELVSDEFRVVADGNPAAPLIVWQQGSGDETPTIVSGPFVSPRRSHPGSRRALPKGCPDDFRPLDALARRQRPPGGFEGAKGNVGDSPSTAIHEALRSARRCSLLAALQWNSQGVTAQPDVDVVCVSRRPGRAAEVVALFDAQTYGPRRLTIVTTVPIDAEPVIRQLRVTRPDVIIVERPGRTLGACLNEFIDNTSAVLVAKWDDDDWYGPNYLLDLVLDRNATGAAVTGKHSCFVYLEPSDSTHVRFPGQEFRDTSFLAGGTLLLDVDALRGTRFPDVNLGEDSGLLAACLRGGLRVRSADTFNYVQMRGADNTWQVSDAEFLARSAKVGQGLRLDRAAL